MSRSGKIPIPVPKGVEISLKGKGITVKGPKGALEGPMFEGVTVEVEEGQVSVTSADGKARLQGLQRALINNMVVGTSQGFEKRLELIGVGFRAAVKGQSLELQLGFSHPTEVAIPQGIEIVVEKNTTVVVKGVDKQRVGQLAADIRSLRPPEPYKGKGVRYVDEFVRKKAGKSAK